MRRLLVVALFALVVVPAAHAPASEEDPFPRAAVVGIGNRVSGRIAVGIVGEKGCPWHVAFREAAKEIEARTDLRVEVSVTKGSIPRPGFTVRSSRQPENGRSVEQAVEAIREFILCQGDVAYHRTAFAPIVHRVEGSTLHLEVKALLPGTVDLTVLTVEGDVLLPPGPVRSIDLTGIADHDDALVRVRFTGQGNLRDEIRYWLPDLLPGGDRRVRIEGASRVPAGEPVLLRVVLEGPDRHARAVKIEFGGRTVSTVTDRAGVATVSFPPFPSEETGAKALRAEVDGRFLTGTVRVVDRTVETFIETDRPAYRPGGEVRLRVLLLDAVNRNARAGAPVRVEVHNPRKQRIAAFTGVTGEFGEATFVLPLARGIVEGRYRAEVEGGDQWGDATFRVEELRRPPFEVTVEFDREFYTAADPVRATVRARTWPGEPIGRAEVEVRAGRAGEIREEGHLDSDGVLTIELPPPGKGTYRAPFRTTVRKAGAKVSVRPEYTVRPDRRPYLDVATDPDPLIAGVPGRVWLTLRNAAGRAVPGVVRFAVDGDETMERETEGSAVEVPVRPSSEGMAVALNAVGTTRDGDTTAIDLRIPCRSGGIIEVDDVLAPGATATVRYRTAGESGALVLDLYVGGRLAGSATSAPGESSFDLPVRDGLGGPAILSVRTPAGPWLARRTVRIGDPKLSLGLAVDRAEVEPGERVVLEARVTGTDGTRPALLDVRGFDRSYLELAGGFTSRVPGFLGKKPETPRDPVLAEYDPDEPFAALARRGKRAVEEQLRRALSDPEYREPAPWGSPIFLTADLGTTISLGRRAGYVVASTEPPVTARPGREGDWPIAPPFVWVHHGGRNRDHLGETLLPTGAPRVVAARNERHDAIEGVLGFWLARHQSPDGSWRPYAFTNECEGRGCEDRGDPRLHPGTTALAILAYLGAGETHKHGRHRHVVRNGLRFLKSVQRPNGHFGDPAGPWALLNHAMATLSLAEAYAFTGSPLFKQSATIAVRRLVSLQREDGSFGERGFARGSLLATGWAVLALKSASMSGLPDTKEPMARAREWVLARADPETRVVSPTTEERAGYPFDLGPDSVAPAGITAMILIQTGSDPRKDSLVPAIEPPADPTTDLHAAWWGALAAFQVGGDTWRAYHGELAERMYGRLHRGGCGHGSWSPLGQPMGRIAATAFGALCLESYYRYSRVFGSEVGGASTARVRSDFPDLATVDLALPTDENGRARIPVTLPDNLTTWDFLVGAWDGRGGYATGRVAVRADLPLAIEGEMPVRLTEGDRLTIPLRIRSRRDAPGEVEVVVTTSKNLEIVQGPGAKISVPARDAVAAPVVLRATAPGPGFLRVRVAGAEHADAWEVPVSVRPARYPFAAAVPLTLGENTPLEYSIPRDAERLRGRLEIGLSPMDDADLALRGLIRRPTGCFEQTAATLYPLLFATAYLERTGLADAALRARARRHLMTGYQRLLGCEVRGGGFSLYGDSPADPALTALGIHLLLDLGTEIAVDRDVIDRAAAWLKTQGPVRHARRAARVYAAGAMVRAGVPLPEKLARWIRGRRDPYLVALAAVNGLADLPGREAVIGALAERPWTTDQSSPFTHAQASSVEVTALAVLALHRLGGDRKKIDAAVGRLRAARTDDGAWRTTRETVVALRTLLEVVDLKPVHGRLTLTGDGREPVSVDLHPRADRQLDPGPITRTTRIRVAYEGEGRPTVRLVVTGDSARPPAAETDLVLNVKWPSDPQSLGLPFRVPVSVRHRGGKYLNAPMVVVPLPAGCRLDREQLDVYMEDALDDAGVDLLLVREGRAEIYLRRMGQETISFSLPIVADFAGVLATGPSRAYPYYEPDRGALVPGVTLTVK